MPVRMAMLDPSFIIALENKDDPHHSRAKQLDNEFCLGQGILLLHWGILYEIADGYARINRRQKGIGLLRRLTEEQGYLIHPISDDLVNEALALYCNRADKDWGLTDCTSFVLMKQLGVSEAMTADVHFRQAGFSPLLLD